MMLYARIVNIGINEDAIIGVSEQVVAIVTKRIWGDC